MTPEALAQLHRAAFTRERPWQAAEFAELLKSPFTALLSAPHGFALIRTIAGESELLTLAVDPSQQRRGIARALLRDWLDGLAASGASRAFLEVAADNDPALALYRALGFEICGIRRGYYQRAQAPAADALLMARDVTLGQPAQTTGSSPESS
jgi:ribosomal-protein-alanine N-acetyltransferase